MSIDTLLRPGRLALLPLAVALVCSSPVYSAQTDSCLHGVSEYELPDWRQMFERQSLERCGDRDLIECYALDIAVIDDGFLKQRCSAGGPYALEIRGSREIDAQSAQQLRANGMEVLQLRRADGTVYQATAPKAFVFCNPDEYYDAIQRGIIRDYEWILDLMRSVRH